MDERLQFADESAAPGRKPWILLVVDDDADVHTVTRLALGDFHFEGRPVEILSALSAEDARRLWRKTPDIALVLLDVVMETEHAGLDFVRFVREEMKNPRTRIVLRTGQPGQAPALDVVRRYEIDDYRAKTELTFERLHVLVSTALRTYRLLEQMDQRQRRLEDSNLDLERFAYVASHDLQTPLRGIISFTQILQQRYAASLPPEARELLDQVVGSSHKLVQLIRDLLEYSRVGNAQDALQTVDLNKVLDGVCERLRSVMDQRGVTLERSELPALECNPTLLSQALANLIENAIKFQPDKNPWVRVEAREVGAAWEIRVADRGIGIDAQYLDYVFEPFRRLHMADVFPGTGIGLAICRRVAESHGGSIRAESVKGEGTTMIVTLPKKLEHGGQTPSAH